MLLDRFSLTKLSNIFHSPNRLAQSLECATQMVQLNNRSEFLPPPLSMFIGLRPPPPPHSGSKGGFLGEKKLKNYTKIGFKKNWENLLGPICINPILCADCTTLWFIETTRFCQNSFLLISSELLYPSKTNQLDAFWRKFYKNLEKINTIFWL